MTEPTNTNITFFDPTTVDPKFLIISCTADVSYVDQIAEGLFEPAYFPVRGQDYLEFLHPGSFPVDESLDAIVDVSARFSIPKIAIITHIDCGLIEAISKLSNYQNPVPTLFANYGQAVIAELEQRGVSKDEINKMSLGELTQVLSRLIAYRISIRLRERSQSAKLHLSPSETSVDPNIGRVADLNKCEIGAFAYSEKGQSITQVIPYTIAEELTF